MAHRERRLRRRAGSLDQVVACSHDFGRPLVGGWTRIAWVSTEEADQILDQGCSDHPHLRSRSPTLTWRTFRPCESELPSSDLPLEVAERLGPYYVYALVDPTDESVFYVGKGSRRRLLAHGREADLAADARSSSGKLSHIRAIREAGYEPRVDVVRHGLDESQALLVEAALIDALEGLTNANEGHGAEYGRQPLSEYVGRYGAPLVAADAPAVVLIRVGRWKEVVEEMEPGVWRHGNGHRPGITQQELLDSARGWWKISPTSIQRRGIRHAVAVYDGVTRLVMEIGDWTQREDLRRAFTATPVLDGPMFDAWLGPLGKRVAFTAASRNPIAYWPLKADRSDH